MAVFFSGSSTVFRYFFSDFQLFQSEHHLRDFISRNAHLVHQNWYRISFTYQLKDLVIRNNVWNMKALSLTINDLASVKVFKKWVKLQGQKVKNVGNNGKEYTYKV
jgi:hypothetical protein